MIGYWNLKHTHADVRVILSLEKHSEQSQLSYHIDLDVD